MVSISLSYPQDPGRRQQWIASIKRETYTPDNEYVCSKHFYPDDLDDSSPSGVTLREGAVPRLQYAIRSGRPINHKHRAVRERLAAAKRGIVRPRSEGMAVEGASRSGSSGVNNKTPNADPNPRAAAPPPSPSKKIIKKRLAKAERRLGDAGVRIIKLKRRKHELEGDKDDLERKVTLLEVRAAFDEDYIKTLEEQLKDDYTLEGPPMPSNVWDDMES